MTKEFGETFSDTVKVGIVVSIMPQAVQELVYQSIGDKLEYDEVTAKIRSVVSNKVAPDKDSSKSKAVEYQAST